MSNPLVIEYESEVREQPAERFLRRIVCWSAIVYGAMGLLGMALRVALANGWVISPPSTGWAIEGRWEKAVVAMGAAINAVLLCGGVRLLYRSRWSVIILRASAASLIALMIASYVMRFHFYPYYTNIWSSPAAPAIYLLQFLGALWVPALILLLTLPPLARRMVLTSDPDL